MAGVGREAVMRSGEGGGGGPTDVGVWRRVRKVNKIARLKGQDWELYPWRRAGPREGSREKLIQPLFVPLGGLNSDVIW